MFQRLRRRSRPNDGLLSHQRRSKQPQRMPGIAFPGRAMRARNKRVTACGLGARYPEANTTEAEAADDHAHAQIQARRRNSGHRVRHRQPRRELRARSSRPRWRPAIAISTPRENTAPSAASAKPSAPRRAAGRDFPDHQGVARGSACRRFRALDAGEPAGARSRSGRSAAGALAGPRHAAAGDHGSARRDEASRSHPPCRGCEFQHRAAR